MSPEKRPRGRLRQSEVFFPLADRAIVAHHVVLPGLFVLVLSRIIQIFDRAIVISDKVWKTLTIVRVAFLVSEEYSTTHDKLKDCLDQ